MAYGAPVPPQRKSQRGILLVVLALLVVGAIVAGAILVFGGDDGGSDEQVVLEPIGTIQQDDFFGNLDAAGGDIGSAVAGLATADAEDPREAGASGTGLAGQVAQGVEPGLYGGSRDTQVCDVAQLVSFLQDEANADKAEAWANALNIDVADIPTYVGGLTAVRLRYDTRVTNHGFRDGEANPFQSVLEAGTAVLVDNTGVPRVKCNCGNPLAPPEGLNVSGDAALDTDGLAQNPDEAWDGFDPNQVVEVEAGAQPVDVITIVDIDSGGLIDRPVGSDGASQPDTGTGDVQITLQWDSEADLDLHVVEPDGTEIYYGAHGPSDSPSSTGGQLDVDANALCGNPEGFPGGVENVFWPPGDAPSGDYQISVVGFDVSCGAGDFTLTVRAAGQDEQTYSGTVGEDEQSQIFTLTV